MDAAAGMVRRRDVDGECAAAGGSIQLVLGPMFSGKSSEMSRRIRRHRIAMRRCVVIKYSEDLRYEGSEDAVVTHDAVRLPARPASALAEVDSFVCEGFDVVGIDEGQFFDDVVEFAERWASMGKTVIVAALDGDFRRRPFGRVLELVPLAEDVVKLSAVCTMCSAAAAFTKRITAESAVEVVGGADMYRAMCRQCHAAPDDARADESARAAVKAAAAPGSAGRLLPPKRASGTPLTPLNADTEHRRERALECMDIPTPSPRVALR